MAFCDFEKHQKSIGPRPFWSNEESQAKNLMKPVVYGDFLGHFRKMAPKSIQKALGFPLKVQGVLRLCKSQKSIGPRAFWHIQKGP